ncbi:MAG TPA: FAD-dependent oxidoreductase [Chloroflexota bacterium]|nr:FAD-dependent oxidoreductase [Chloroflexota bacterium]
MPKRYLPRVAEARRDAADRRGDFGEVAMTYTPQDARQEALRCLSCRRAPCATVCPFGTRADLYVPLIAQGKLDEAAAVLRQTDPFPAICARVCHRPCETVCLAAKVDFPIAIRSLKRYLVEATDGSVASPSREGPLPAATGRVAVVGSGPAGLAAARALLQLGHAVVVFEGLEEPGGLLRWGIPAYRLPRDVVAEAVREAEALGVEFRTGQRLGRDFELKDLRDDGFRALLLAIGAHRSVRLGISGEDLPWVVPGLAYLRAAAANTAPRVGGPVVVVGGGDAALDAARTARRLGGDPVTIVYRRSRAEMPARHEEVLEAEEEGIEFRFLASPVSAHEDSGRWVRLQGVGLEDAPEGGRPRPVPIPGSEWDLPADLLIAAVGQVPDPEVLPESLRGSVRGGTISVDPETLATELPGVYACGDAAGGRANVTDAAAMGQRAAQSIHAYLTATRDFPDA